MIGLTLTDWIGEIQGTLRTHPITADNRWLVATSYALLAELTSANKRIDDLEETLVSVRAVLADSEQVL